MPDTATSRAPELPFALHYSPRVLQEIRMAVSDAFYSLPKGGAEIGGILLGDWSGKRLTISDSRPLDCEHAFGPSFTLSERDREKLAEMIASVKAAGARVIGWYHSHTRSEIFLSEADLEIYRDFFPEPWQVALVLRPGLNLPTRAGLFFRDASGAVRSEVPHRELRAEPLEAKPQQTLGARPAPVEAKPEAVEAKPEAVEAKPEAVETAEPSGNGNSPVSGLQPIAAATRPTQPVPRFLEKQAPAPRVWPRIAIPLLIGAAIGAPAYWKRDAWFPWAMALVSTSPLAAPPAALGLHIVALDNNLQIRWDPRSPAVSGSAGGVLRITGADQAAQDISLDHEHLRSGVLTVANPSWRVDASLTLNRATGQPVIEATAFVRSSEPMIQASGGSEEIAKLRADLDAEIEKNRKLQLDVNFLAKQYRELRDSR